MTIAESGRPNPEQFLSLIRRQARGRLKVYLGSAAGVGKTYAMLREGHRLKKQGVDVVIGFVETHGRAETHEQIGDLEIIPPRIVEYRGVKLREMDLDAILARRPTVCLVDELAHTNVPGSKHAKRFQDVEELLLAGIHVITTVNIQHFESLYDEIERATGVKVKERFPDRVLAEADQIVNVDVSVEDLIERLKTGKIYPQERISVSLENFFTPTNLTRLRELTLTEAAHLIDRRSRRAEADQQPLAATDRVMVGVSSRAPNASGASSQDRADRRSAQCSLVCRLRADPRRGTDPHRRRDPAVPQQEPRARPAAWRHPHDLPRARCRHHDVGLCPGIRHQGHRHGQEPPALAPPHHEKLDPRPDHENQPRRRYHDRRCLSAQPPPAVVAGTLNKDRHSRSRRRIAWPGPDKLPAQATH